jgi:hypothetical protein
MSADDQQDAQAQVVPELVASIRWQSLETVYV